MKLSIRKMLVLVLAAVPLTVIAQTRPVYPNHAVRLIVPYAPGASTDITARMLGAWLEKKWGQPVIVENKAGGGATIGSDLVAKAAPDGYTLLLATSGVFTGPAFFKNMPYNPVRDFAPISLIAASGYILIAPSNLPVKNLREFVAYAKANPGKLNYGTPGGDPILEGARLKQRAGIDLLHIQYKGGGPLTNALAAGEVQLMYAGPHQAAPLVKAGKAIALAFTRNYRHPLLPEVPTMAESGYADFEAYYWVALLAPANTPKDIVTSLNRDVVEFSKAAENLEKFAALGWDPAGSTPEQLADISAQFTRRAIEGGPRAGIVPE